MRSCASCGAFVRTQAPCTCPDCGATLCEKKLRSPAVLLMGLVAGCADPFTAEPPYGLPDSSDSAMDRDGDSYSSRVDCDDDNAEIHPDAPEKTGDGVDSNCNGSDDT